MSIIWDCSLSVEAYAAAGKAVEAPRPSCPICEAEMIFWSGYLRPVRFGSTFGIWVRRGRCPRCEISHSLLPSFLLVRRLDAVEVIGEAISALVEGTGSRSVAKSVGAEHATTRSWWRRHCERSALAVALMVVFGYAVTATAPAMALDALVAPGRRPSDEHSPATWRSVSLRCGGNWLTPVHHHHLTPSLRVEGGGVLL